MAAFWVSAWHTGAAPAAAATPWTDFNGDGFADLAIGAPRQDVDGKRGVGQVNVMYGSATGLAGAEFSGLGEGYDGLTACRAVLST